jgi:restriction system protein
MAVPRFDALMLPLLQIAADDKQHRLNDVVPALASALKLSDADRAEQIPSGQSRLRNRVYWAKLYLSQAKAIDTVGPGLFQITQRGRELLARSLDRITPDLLMEYPEFRSFRAKSKSGSSSKPTAEITSDEAAATHDTPQDSIQAAYDELKAAVVRELLDAVQAAPFTFLESLIIRLLIAMGYGDADSGTVLGGIGVHEGGVDGVVKKDRLGLGRIYVQAKRYKDGLSVGAPAVQQFAGSMKGRHADEGVFVTTSTFTKDARDYVKTLGDRIALIDGPRLAELMFELGIGVTTERVLTLKRIDSDFFAEG